MGRQFIVVSLAAFVTLTLVRGVIPHRKMQADFAAMAQGRLVVAP